MLGVLVSRSDDASVAIGEQLREIGEWTAARDETRPDADGGGRYHRIDGAELRTFDALHLDLERPAEAFGDIDLLVFASKHAGETGRLLTAHHTGNVGPADHGGEPNTVARACPNAHARVLSALETHAPDGYAVGTECTHHGPTAVGAPSMFVEIGSTRAAWTDRAAARAVARSILDLRGVSPDRPPERGPLDPADDRGDRNRTRRHLLGVGGGHYAPRFERVVRETDWAVGHVLADWGLERIDPTDSSGRALLRDALDASRAGYALVDGDRPAVERAIEDAGGRVVSETWVRETAGVPLGLARRVEDRVDPVDDGLRFGDPVRDYDASFVVSALPAELLEEARAIDRAATRDAVASLALAFGTDQGGTRVTGPVALADEDDRAAVVDRLLDVLRQRYDSVERDGGVAIARRSAFDPDRARRLGVPEGPAFGRLANGEAVEVDGDRIPPEAVREEQERRFPLQM